MGIHSLTFVTLTLKLFPHIFTRRYLDLDAWTLKRAYVFLRNVAAVRVWLLTLKHC